MLINLSYHKPNADGRLKWVSQVCLIRHREAVYLGLYCYSVLLTTLSEHIEGNLEVHH